MSTAAVLSQGTELTSGHTLDSNANWICQQLWNLGYTVQYILTVPDSQESIANAFQESVEKASLIVSTGGLGPTEDDHTISALVDAFDLKLEFKEQAWKHIVNQYAKRNRTPPAVNKKMAYLPHEATLIENPLGTAMGLCLAKNSSKIYCFPGVPTEMRRMFRNSIPPGNSTGVLFEIATLGLPESELANRVSPLLPTEVQVGFQASRRGNIIKLFFPDEVDTELIHKISAQITDHIYGFNNCDLASVIGKELKIRNETLSIAESCTAGKLAAWVGSISGASRYFSEGVVVYSNTAKIRYCDVPNTLIQQYGAVSQEVAIALAEGIRKTAKTEWSLAITGVAGPTGGTVEKPIGTVHIACAGQHHTVHKRFQFRGNRDQITDSSIAYALFMLFKQLTKNTD